MNDLNVCLFTGRLTKDPEIKTVSNDKLVASFTLAVNKMSVNGEKSANFVNAKAFGKWAEHLQKYWHKGMKMVMRGEYQSGSYTNKEGKTVYTNDFIASDIGFAESKKTSESNGVGASPIPNTDSEGFMTVPEGIDDEMPFGLPNR